MQINNYTLWLFHKLQWDCIDILIAVLSVNQLDFIRDASMDGHISFQSTSFLWDSRITEIMQKTEVTPNSITFQWLQPVTGTARVSVVAAFLCIWGSFCDIQQSPQSLWLSGDLIFPMGAAFPVFSTAPGEKLDLTKCLPSSVHCCKIKQIKIWNIFSIC